MITVRVPATSANLGPGFDAIGLALDLYNEMKLEETDALEIRSLDSIAVPTDTTNLVYQSIAHLYANAGRTMPTVRILQTNNVPLARGLGSSSACIVGGLVAANELMGGIFSQKELLRIACTLEGHPDNVAPALLGGLVTAVIDRDEVFYTKQTLPDDLSFITIIPDMEMKTSEARGVLPHQITHHDAVFNLARAALMVQSLTTGAYENLKTAAADCLHQPYRLPAIPHAIEILDYAYEQGAYAAMLSGAGPTLLVIADKQNTKLANVIASYTNELGLSGWRVETHKADNTGAVLLQQEGV